MSVYLKSFVVDSKVFQTNPGRLIMICYTNFDDKGRNGSENKSWSIPTLKFYRVEQLTEIGWVNTQIRSDVFVWYKLK